MIRPKWVLIGLATLGFSLGFGWLSQRVSADLNGDIALGLITFLGGGGLAVWSFNRTKAKEAESRLFAEKAKIYDELVSELRDLFMAQKGWKKKPDEDALGKKLMEIRYKIIVWGGERTLRAISAMESVAPGDSGKQFVAGADLYKAIRQDLDHEDTADFGDELFLAQITADDREKVRDLLKDARRKS